MSLQGRLLVAEPMLRDPNFHRTVVLLLEHHEDEGALGLVLNRPGDLAVRDAVPSWAPYVTGIDRIFVGGPVTPEGAVCLVRRPSESGPAEIVRHLTPTLGVLDLHADPSDAPGDISALRIFGGYSGWSAGQLESEMELGGWLVLDPVDDDVFTEEPDSLWRRVLQRQPGELRARAHFPDDPMWN